MRKAEEIKYDGDGFHRCYKNVGIIGSFGKHMQDIARAKRVFEQNGFKVLVPIDTEISDERSIQGFLVLEKDAEKRPRDLEHSYLSALLNCDVIYVCNRDGYIGKSVMFEIGFLMYPQKTDIIFQAMPTESLLIDMMTDNDGTVQNIMTPEEVCAAMKKSNYYSLLDTQKFLPGQIPSEAHYREGAPIEHER